MQEINFHIYYIYEIVERSPQRAILKAKLRISIVMTYVGWVFGNRCSELGWVLVDSFAPKLVGYHSRWYPGWCSPPCWVRTVHLRDLSYQNANYENRPIQGIKTNPKMVLNFSINGLLTLEIPKMKSFLKKIDFKYQLLLHNPLFLHLWEWVTWEPIENFKILFLIPWTILITNFFSFLFCEFFSPGYIYPKKIKMKNSWSWIFFFIYYYYFLSYLDLGNS